MAVAAASLKAISWRDSISICIEDTDSNTCLLMSPILLVVKGGGGGEGGSCCC